MSNLIGEKKTGMRILEGGKAREYLQKKRKEANNLFKEWQKELCDIIRTQSQIVFNKDGTYQFILPTRLVKLVWATTIQERIKVEQLQGGTQEEIQRRALTKLRAEVETAHKEFTTAPAKLAQEEEKKRKKEEEEEKEAKAKLIELREQMMKEKENGESNKT